MRNTIIGLVVLLGLSLFLGYLLLSPIFAPGAGPVDVSSNAAFAVLMARSIFPALASLAVLVLSVSALALHWRRSA